MQIEVLKGFGLPPTFPPFMVPPKVAEFVKKTQEGMTKEEVLSLATEYGLNPEWRHLPHIGENAYNLNMTSDGMAVPLVAIMTLVEQH